MWTGRAARLRRCRRGWWRLGRRGEGVGREGWPADTRSWTALKMGNVVVTGQVDLGVAEITANITVQGLDVNVGTATGAGGQRLGWAEAVDLEGGGQPADGGERAGWR